MKHSDEYYLGKASPIQAIIHMCVPMAVAMCVNVAANLVDAFFIGGLNDAAALAAITLAMPFTTLIMALADLVGVGSSTLIARLLGSGNKNQARCASATSTYLALALGVAFALVCLAFLNPVCRALGAHGDMLDPTMLYVGILAAGAPFSLMSFALDQNVRAEGAAGASAAGAVVSTVVNIVLDALFICGFGWGVAGAGLATAFSWVVMTIYLAIFTRKSAVQSLLLRDVSVNSVMLKEIFGVGFSAFAASMIMAVSTWLLDVLAAGYSTEAVAGLGIAVRVQMIADIFAISVGQGVVPLFAFAYAARNVVRIRALTKATSLTLLATLGTASVLLIVGAVPLVSVFSQDAAVIEAGHLALVILTVGAAFSAVTNLVVSVLQAFGKALPATVLPLARGGFTVVLYIAGNALFGFVGLLGANALAELASCVLAAAFALWFAHAKTSRRVRDAELS